MSHAGIIFVLIKPTKEMLEDVDPTFVMILIVGSHISLIATGQSADVYLILFFFAVFMNEFICECLFYIQWSEKRK